MTSEMKLLNHGLFYFSIWVSNGRGAWGVPAADPRSLGTAAPENPKFNHRAVKFWPSFLCGCLLDLLTVLKSRGVGNPFSSNHGVDWVEKGPSSSSNLSAPSTSQGAPNQIQPGHGHLPTTVI